jgi:hypothetical protein
MPTLIGKVNAPTHGLGERNFLAWRIAAVGAFQVPLLHLAASRRSVNVELPAKAMSANVTGLSHFRLSNPRSTGNSHEPVESLPKPHCTTCRYSGGTRGIRRHPWPSPRTATSLNQASPQSIEPPIVRPP